VGGWGWGVVGRVGVGMGRRNIGVVIEKTLGGHRMEDLRFI